MRKGCKPASVEDKGASLLESSTGREITAARWFHVVVQLRNVTHRLIYIFEHLVSSWRCWFGTHDHVGRRSPLDAELEVYTWALLLILCSPHF